MTTAEIVGRDGELAFLDAFLDRPERELRAVVLEGEAGVGKSTLWSAAVAAARERGFGVLSSRPAEAERALAHVVLADLLEGVLEEVLPALSAPRRQALEVALLVDRPSGYAVDPRALAVAVRTAVQVLAHERPLVLAVDDSQWLDASSAAALAFALRRLRGEHVVVLLARRLGEHSEAPGIEGSIDSEAVERLLVGPLSLGAMHVLLQRRLDRPFARPALLRLHEISGGNAFYALELARALASAGTTGDPTQPFPVPETLERLVGARLAGLGDLTRKALLLVAAHGRPSPATLGAAGVSRAALAPALDAQVVELADGAIRFTHPLLASVLYHATPEEERREAHQRLAGIDADPVERARHLALAADAPDEEIAQAMDDAANEARVRGAAIAAAELAEHALRLTPAGAIEDRQRRTIAAARAHLAAPDAGRARALALELPNRRAEVLVLLSDIEHAAGDLERAIKLRREALETPARAPSIQAEIHEWLASRAHFAEGAESARRHAETALALAEALDDNALRAGALAALAHTQFWAGDADAPRLAERAERAAARTDRRPRRIARFTVVLTAVWSGHLARARTVLESINREWSELGELTTADVHWWLAMIELRCGRFPVAAEHAARANEIRRQYTIDDREEPTSAWLVALIAAHRGELERARALVEGYLPLTESQLWIHSQAEAVLALVEQWSGNPTAAEAHFAVADAVRSAVGVIEPAMNWWCGDYAEALLALGRPDEAAAVVDAWEAEAARLGREAVLAQATRCRALVAAARGDVGHALTELERAVAQHEAISDPFGRARALLGLGVVRRRARQKRAAREATESALAIFEECGAEGWAEKARSELGRIGGRQREEGLTAAEQRVAALVAEGRTNREVAAALFLGERTVETHLSHIYAKLKVRSRTELARSYTSAT